ncbi:MAG TPA: hypothetical protein VM290_05830 [Gaiellaceae bacterium]|nr:hypothetical protein [Gaiellaceae bacterium]
MPILLLLLGVVVLLVVGWALVSLTFKLLGLVLTGVVVGALARLVLPGSQPIGWLMTILAGIAGSLGGGLLASVLGVGGLVQFVLAVALAAALIAFVIVPRRGALAR